MSKRPALRVLMPMHDGFDGMDFFGPVEILSLARWSQIGEDSQSTEQSSDNVFEITTAAVEPLTKTEQGIQVVCHISISEAYQQLANFDILIIPGGSSAEILKKGNEPMGLIGAFASLPVRSNSPRIIMSVCTGALFLAKAGILGGRTATTNWQDITRLKEMTTNTSTILLKRFVVNIARTGPQPAIMTAAGPGAGLDLSLWLVQHIAGREAKESVQGVTQYQAQFDEGLVLD